MAWQGDCDCFSRNHHHRQSRLNQISRVQNDERNLFLWQTPQQNSHRTPPLNPVVFPILTITVVSTMRIPLIAHSKTHLLELWLPCRQNPKMYLSSPSLFGMGVLMLDNWGAKAKRRKTTGTGRMRYLKTVACRFKNGLHMTLQKALH